MFEAINQYVRKCVQISDEELAFYNSLLEVREYPKKTFLLQAGELCDFEAYITKGCVRTYYIDANGSEVILSFAIEDWWVGDPASLAEGTPTKMFIETLEPTTILSLNREHKDQLLVRVPQFERMYRIMITRNLSVLQNRLFATIAKSAQTRYQEFLEKYPQIPLRVPQHYIASYLGISPEFLSKIRKRQA